jgi:hypothetical protein
MDKIFIVVQRCSVYLQQGLYIFCKTPHLDFKANRENLIGAGK